jgi:hypothetical protein
MTPMQQQAAATWSIAMADAQTQEVAVGTVTCLTSFDLLAIVPVVVVGKGAAAVQASGDFDGIRRPIIFQHLMLGTPPAEILAILAGISGHQSRQYGIVDTQGRMVTFTGSSTLQWAGGVIGTDGSMVYAIQGNILAGGCVVPAIEQAILTTSGDMPAKLMAGMEAARLTGGDGRCSCSSGNPTGCGCPPASFTKSGHIGGMVVARVGDGDDPVCNASGCADGDYFMRLNVPHQSSASPDPVAQLNRQFGDWRALLVGRPDAMRSTVTILPDHLPANGVSTAEMQIQLRDWQDLPLASGVATVTVNHAPESDALSSIGPVIDLGNGAFSVTLTASTAAGTDSFWVEADDGVRPVILAPAPVLQLHALGDADGDGDVDLDDYADWDGCMTGPDGGPYGAGCEVFDFEFDADVDSYDFAAFQLAFTGSP